ncbi:MAG: flagellar basal body P-ring formation chaperone FlgA [Kiloniellaceae bacterium]
MRLLFTVLSVILLAAANAAATQSGTDRPVILKSRAIVEDNVVKLQDLFDGLGERGATAIARAPAPGRPVEVDARWLAAVAQAHALPWRPSSRLDTVVIERASRIIETRRIEAEVLNALARRGVAGNVSLGLDNPALRIYLPSEAVPTLTITGLSHDPASGRFTAHLVAPAEGTPLAKATVTGRAVQMAEIPVLRRRMIPGEVIRRRDIDWISARADRLGRNAITDVADLLGKSPRRPIRAGDTVLAGEVREPIVVPKNSLVTIKLETPRMVLTAQGRALEQGAEGDVIRVVNTKSHKVISATVADPGMVRIRPADIGAANRRRFK